MVTCGNAFFQGKWFFSSQLDIGSLIPEYIFSNFKRWCSAHSQVAGFNSNILKLCCFSQPLRIFFYLTKFLKEALSRQAN